MTDHLQWLKRSRARIFLDMHLPAWPGMGIAEKLDPPRIASAIADCGADAAVIFAKCQYGNFYTSIEGEALHPGLGGRDFLRETSSGLRKRGVRTIAYYSVSWDERFADERPEWLTEDAAGNCGAGPYRWRTLCINSPYAQVVERHMASLAAAPVDGIWLDMTIVGDGNCYCPRCRACFEKASGRQPPTDPSDPRFPEFLDFRYDLVEAFYQRIRAVIRGAGPRAAFINNYWGYPHSSTGMGCRAIGSTRQADCVTGEAYSDWSGIRSTSFLPIFLRGAAGGRPYEALIGTSVNTWDYTKKPKAFLAYEAYAVFAHGAAVTVDDQPFHDGTLDEPLYRGELGEIFRDITSQRESVGGKPVRHAAVYHSQASKDRCASPSAFVRDMTGAFRILRDLHLPVEFIFDETVSSGMLEGIEVLVLPNVSFLGGREWSALCAFMDRGGLVIASGSLGGDECAREVEETFGLRRGPQSRFSVSYLSMPGAGPRGILVRGAYVEYPGTPEGTGAVVEPICETGPREFFHNNLPAPYRRTTVPGLIERAKGGGALALFPQPIFRHYAKEPSRELREVVRSLVGRHAKPPVVELRVPLKMDYSIYRDGDTLYVHLLNPNVEPSICCGLMDTLDGDYERSYEYMEETAPVLDLELLVHGGKCKSVRTLREKFPFSVSAAEQGTEIRIARVDIWEIVKIELAVKESGAWA